MKLILGPAALKLFLDLKEDLCHLKALKKPDNTQLFTVAPNTKHNLKNSMKLI